MRREIILQKISNPDSEFLKIMEELPDPKPEFEKKIVEAMPQLHEFFIQKRDAFNRRDLVTFQKILAKEIDFVRDLDHLAFHY